MTERRSVDMAHGQDEMNDLTMTARDGVLRDGTSKRLVASRRLRLALWVLLIAGIITAIVVPSILAAKPKAPPLTPEELKALQLENYRAGNGLIINVHVAHTGGSTLCDVFGHAKGTDGAPVAACQYPRADQGVNMTAYPAIVPWSSEATAKNVDYVRQFFHFIAWEFLEAPDQPYRKGINPKLPISSTHWEDPNIVSVLVVRDPIERFLAPDDQVQKEYPGLLTQGGDLNTWMNYTNHPLWTNNFQVGVLAGKGCCNQTHTDPIYLERAKELASRFTAILDMACLDRGLATLARALDLTVDLQAGNHKRTHATPPEVPRPTKNLMVRHNHVDSQFYQWAKQQALHVCE